MRGVIAIRYPLFWAVGFWMVFGPSAFATPTPEEVSKNLVAAFAVETGKTPKKPTIVNKDYVGFKTRTLTFGIGNRVYRIVFSSDGTLTVAVTAEGEIGAQPLWTANLKNTTIEEIVNIVYSREFGRKYDPTLLGVTPPGNLADQAAEQSTGRSGDELRMDRLMSRIFSGDLTAGLDSRSSNHAMSESAAAKATGLSKLLNPCDQNRGGAQPQRQTVSDIALAMAAARIPAHAAELTMDRSRNYSKKKGYSFMNELGEHQAQPNPNEVFRLIKQSGSDAYELFRAALKDSDKTTKDAYALAAHRNFRTVARGAGEEKGKRIVDQVLNKTIVDVDSFTSARRLTPKAAVVHDRKSGEFFVDPTLTSPTQAQYLLSLAVLYAWRIQEPETLAAVTGYEEIQRKIARLEHAVLDDQDEKELAQYRSEARKLAERLFQISDELRKTGTRPTT